MLLDTSVHHLEMKGGRIESLEAYSSQDSVSYLLKAPLFCDATGDGTVAYQAVGGEFPAFATIEIEPSVTCICLVFYGHLLVQLTY